MDKDTSDALQSTLGLVDHVNAARPATFLALHIALSVAANTRRIGKLDDVAVASIEAGFDEAVQEASRAPNRGGYPGVLTLIESARALWDASEPK